MYKVTNRHSSQDALTRQEALLVNLEVMSLSLLQFYSMYSSLVLEYSMCGKFT
jgi:hypothetical protein